MTTHLFGLDGRIVAVIGAGSGIGEAIAIGAAGQGAIVSCLDLDAAKAVEVIGQLEPRIIIPMQYQTPMGDKQRDPLEKFLKEMGVTEVTPRDKLTVRASDLGESPEVVVLEP